MMNRIILLVLLVVCFCNSFATTYYVGGAGASDNNPGTASQPFATIQKAANVAVAGDVINIRAGSYRETIVPANSGTSGNPIIYQAEGGAVAVIKGTNPITTAWTVHSGNIYKTSVTLPINGYGSSITSTTSLMANQVFRNDVMQFEARWPKVSSASDLLEKSKWRSVLNTVEIGDNSVIDHGLPSIPGGLVGGYVIINGWFATHMRAITSYNGGNSFGYALSAQSSKYRKFYFITGKLGLLTEEQEWHYENGTLYYRQPGGGSPTGVEYKARNWGFDLRNRSNITINGLQFFACEPVTTTTSSANIIVDNIRARHMNHTVVSGNFNDNANYNASQTGTRLIGPNSVIKNSELRYAGSQGIWLGQNGRAENNLIHDIGYEGSYASGITPWHLLGGQVITRNTIYRVSRTCIDFGGPTEGDRHQNMDVGYNHLYHYNMLNVDGGAIYAWWLCDLTGTRLHHNWIHDSKAIKSDPSGLDGIQVGIYFDQASGPVTVDHNVLWNNSETDYYAEISNHAGNSGGHKLYNNTFASSGSQLYSYVTFITETHDIQRNNIYRKQIVINWGASPGNIANSLMQGVDPQFVGTGEGGLAYRLRAGSPGINAGTVLSGFTDGSVGTPDIGAYEYGGTEWIPGYVAQAATPPPINTPPVVSITTPANNASFTQGAAINITANASDANGSVSKVEFFNGTTKLGEDLISPYSFAWNNATAGTHSLTAKATDNESSVTTSTAVTVTVTGVNTAPTVSISVPSNNAQFVSGVAINMTAVAADANGSVAKVEFFNGTTKLGEDLTSPYNFAWNGAPAGTHSLTAKATDDESSVTTSTVVTVTVTAVNTAPTVSITAPSNNAQFASGTAVNITAVAADADGSVAKVEFFNGTTKLGEDLTSPYNFAWNNAPLGTHAVTAKATDDENGVTTSTPISISVVAPNTVPFVSLTAPANNTQFTSGAAINITADASDANGSIAKVEFFNGTTKLGEDLTSPYSFVWNSAPIGTHAVTARATDNENSVATSTDISITVVAPSAAPLVSLTGPSSNAEFTIGIPVTITATASDANGSVTKVEFFNGSTKLGEDLTSPYSFAWNNAPLGTHVLTAKATDNETSVTTSAPVSITVINTNSAPLVSITGPSNSAQFIIGAPVSITASASDSNGSVTKVEFFNGTTKLGEDLNSPYSFAWNNAPLGTHVLTAKATDNQTSVATSEPISITVAVANTAPLVSITSPSNNAQVTIGASVAITAMASDLNGSVTKVEFFNGATKLGEDLTSPYSFAWNNAPLGTHVLTAKATDNQASVATSAPISITVVNVNVAPTVSITSPTNNSQFTSGVPITIMATAADANGSVTKVEFFNGATKLGEDLTSPYSFAWNNAPLGTHVLTAKATDNQTSVATSTAISISVVSVNVGPTVSITSPTNNSQFTTGVPITITATAADANGSVTKVEFFNGATKLGEDLTSPYSFVWNNAANGAQVLTAKATDNQNSVTTSASVKIVVNNNTAPTVAITSPSNTSLLTAGDPIVITATASDANGSVVKVEFFNGTTKLGEVLTPPYNFTWSNPAAGTYSIIAKATDNLNAVTASAPMPITIVNPDHLTANAGADIFLTLPNNAATLTASYTGSIPDGPATQFNWSQLSGPSSPIFNPTQPEIILTNLIEGVYVFELTVISMDLTSKDVVTITVEPSSIAVTQGTIPRSFSPNGDGVMDFWEWPENELYENSMLTVFNQGGQKVYEAASYQNTWDGTMDGQPLQAGQYQYVIRLKDSTEIKASVRIIR